MVHILGERQRRLLLLLLRQKGRLLENDAMFRGKREQVEQALVRHHLPELEKAGYIEWDRETGEISKGPRFDEIEPILELMEKHDDELPPDWP